MIKKLTTTIVIAIVMLPFYWSLADVYIDTLDNLKVIEQAIEDYYSNIEKQADDALK